MMTTAALLIASLLAPKEVTLEPTDDVWVYQFAQDQTTDEFLRVWSSDGQAVGDSFEGHLTFSYSCLKFDVSKLEGTAVKSAKLVLTHDGAATFTEADSKANPLEARMLPNDWNEANWAYEKAAKIHPQRDPATIFGTGFAGPGSNGEDFTLNVDLMAGPAKFGAAFEEALKSQSKAVSLSLTSKLSPEGQGEGFVYKMFSRHNTESKRPKLVLELE